MSRSGCVLKVMQKLPPVLCIGSSTGGPKALQHVIPQLPADFPAPVLVVQHMPPKFTQLMASRLNQLSPLDVKEAEDGDKLRAGTVYIAPGDRHMGINRHHGQLVVELSDAPPELGVRPSYNFLLRTLGEIDHIGLTLVTLTGMGADGASGLTYIKNRKPAVAIAEAKETAVVYGMPKAAVDTGLIDAELPIMKIADYVIQWFKEVGWDGYKCLS